MSEAARRRIVRVPLIVAAGSKFEKYKPEEERDVRKVTVERDAALEQLIAAWKKYDYVSTPYHVEAYLNALKRIKGLDYSSKDVENFCIALAGFQDEKSFSDKAGHFLSALINNGKDTEYVINTRHLTVEIHGLGHRNTKSITVNGNAGAQVGAYMEGGSITVNGNAGEYVGLDMKRGSITVNGNANQHVGYEMEGGCITVNGDADWGVGAYMGGGEIHIEGDCKGLSEQIEGGKIYHKGVLIVDK